MPVVQLFNLGMAGVNKDIPGHLLPPEVWTDGNNMEPFDTYIKRSLGYQQVFGTPTVAPGFIFYVPAATENFWIYFDLAKAYVYDGIAHTEITRLAGDYAATTYKSWNGCLLGGVPVFNNGNDTPQYWPDLSVVTKLDDLPNWPATLRAKIIRNFGKFLIALNLVDSGSVLSHAIQWSSQAEPGTVPASWDPTDPTVDTGRTHLTDIQGGEIVDALLLGNYLVIYKERSTHLLRFVGGSDVLAPELLFNIGLICPRAMASIDAGNSHFCVGKDNVYVHSGTKSISYPLKEKDRRYFYSDLDSTNFGNLFVVDNPGKEEAWLCYPSEGNTYPNKVLVYNYRTGATSFRDIAAASMDFGTVPVSLNATWDGSVGTTWDAFAGVWNPVTSRLMVAGDPVNTKIWGQEVGYMFGDVAGTSTLQRIAMALTGKDRQGQPKVDYQARIMIKRLWPKIRGTASVDVRIGFQEELDGTVNWTAYQTFVPSQLYMDFVDSNGQQPAGRLPAIEFRSLDALPWQLEGYDVDLEVLGVL